MIVLHHGGPSGHSASVLVMLAEKGLDFDSHELDLTAFAQHDPAFLLVNPAGQVPVLDIDGRRLTESFFILLYLDERFPDPQLGGDDARSRYAAQKWGKYVETHLAPNLAMLGWAVRGTPPSTRNGFDRLPPERRLLWNRACDGFSDSEVANARAAVAKALERVAEDLVEGRWLAGVDYGVADIAAFPHVVHARDLGFAIPPPAAAWLDRIAARPQVHAALAPGGHAVATMGPERGRWG